MAHVTIYMSEDLKKEIHDRAEAEGKSVSAWMNDLAENAVRNGSWLERVMSYYGCLKDSDLEAPPEIPWDRDLPRKEL